MNLNVSSTDSTDENLVSTERNSGSSSASISISFSDDENEKPKIILCEKPSQALLAKKIKSPLKASSTMIPPNQDQIVKSQEILKSEDDHSGVQKVRKIKFSPLKNPTTISDDIASLPAKGDDSEENKIENPALTKMQSDEEEIVDFSVVKSQEILKSEEVDDHSGVQKARKIKYSPLKNPTSISDCKFASQRAG